jgi:hypothetical protein
VKTVMRGCAVSDDVTVMSKEADARAERARRILAVSTPPFAWRYLKARVDAYGRAKSAGMQTPFCKKRFRHSTRTNKGPNDRLTRINLHRSDENGALFLKYARSAYKFRK